MFLSLSISRNDATLCLGERVSPSATQPPSQKPHSIHLFTLSLTSGQGFRFFICAWWSLLRITPGFRIPLGSNICFTSFMRAYACSPHSFSTYGAMLRPVPCSAFNEPSYLFTTRSAMSSMNLLYFSTSLSVPKSWLNMKWRFPSSACPKITASA